MAGKPGPVELYARINPKKYARNAVRVALDNGTLVKGPCAEADAECRGGIEAHHESYAVEDWLTVTWLCRLHHARQHPKVRRAKGPTTAGGGRATSEDRTRDRSITNRVLYR
jgi:hypothetical protein